MISFDDALETILHHAHPGPARSTALSEALGLGLSAPLIAQVDNPAFDNSAVDGYGVRTSAAGRLKVVGSSVAGSVAHSLDDPSAAVRVLTGAPIPAGVEAVVMQEDVTREGDTIVLGQAVKAGSNIRRRAEEYRMGSTLLPTSTRVTPAVVGLLAANGLACVLAPPRPRVAVVVTGDELVPPGGDLGPAQVYESNGPAIAAAVSATGCLPTKTHVRDDRDAIKSVLESALDNSEVVVVTGGVSVGDRDYVKETLLNLGVREVFWRINMKPGKPVFFGVRGNKLVFGLPGNPVSALVTFHLLVRPALEKMMGLDSNEPIYQARLAENIHKKEGRAEFARGILTTDASGLVAKLVPSQGSHMMGGLAVANCLIHLPAQPCSLVAGQVVQITPINGWGG